MVKSCNIKRKFDYIIWNGTNMNDVINLLPNDLYILHKNIGFCTDYILKLSIIDDNGEWHQTEVPNGSYIVYDELVGIPIVYTKQQFKKIFSVK